MAFEQFLGPRSYMFKDSRWFGYRSSEDILVLINEVCWFWILINFNLVIVFFFTCYRHILYYFIESSVLKYLSAIIGNTWESISVDLLCSIHSYTRTFVSYQREILCSGAQVHFTTQTIAWMTFSDNVFTRILDQIRLLVLEPTSLHHSHIGGYAN